VREKKRKRISKFFFFFFHFDDDYLKEENFSIFKFRKKEHKNKYQTQREKVAVPTGLRERDREIESARRLITINKITTKCRPVIK
jgi:hypothetical protein